jgi:PAS domain S-box-containing protein
VAPHHPERPARDPQRAAAAPGPDPVARILVVDDDAGTRIALETTLPAPGLEVVSAESGAAALDLVRRHDFAVILLDIRMPDLDGYETAGLLRRLERGRTTPIVFMTAGNPSPVEQAVGYSLGAVDYMLKPLNLEVLSTKVGVFVELYLKGERLKRQAEDALQAGRALSTSVVEGTPDIVFVKDLEGRYLVVNSALAREMKIRPEEMVGKDDFAVFPRETAEKLREHDRQVVESGQGLSFDETALMPHGVRHFQVTKSPLRDPSGRIHGVIGIARDVTEAKVREDFHRFLAEAGALLAASLDYEVTLETVARLAVPRIADWCAVDVVDHGGEIRRVATVHPDPAKVERGRSYLRARPVSLKDEHGSGAVIRTGEPELVPWIPELAAQAAAWHPEDRKLIEDLGLKSVLIVPMRARGKTLGALTFLTAESGRRYGPRDLELAVEVARRGALAVDNARLYREARREIEDRRRAEEALRSSEDALRASEARLRLALEAAPVAVWTVDARLIVQSCSGKLYGSGGVLPADAYIGRPIEELLGPGHPAVEAHRRALRGDSAAYDLERDGRVYQSRVDPLRDAAGRIVGAVGGSIDVTERKRAEEEVRRLNAGLERRVEDRTAELKQALADLNDFAHLASHDLRTPLRAITGYLDILREDYAGKLLEGDGLECVQLAVAAAEGLERLVADLLEYSRVGRRELVPERLDLGRVVDKALAEMDPDLRGRRAEVTVEGPLGAVRGHAVMLGQVVKNLVSNAVKFVAPDVRPAVRIGARTVDGRLRLRIEDNGIGVPPARRSLLFRMFERLDAGRRYPGSGVGLAIVAKAVERMGGLVGVEDAPGGGSCFWIELPAA